MQQLRFGPKANAHDIHQQFSTCTRTTCIFLGGTKVTAVIFQPKAWIHSCTALLVLVIYWFFKKKKIQNIEGLDNVDVEFVVVEKKASFLSTILNNFKKS